MKPLRVKIEPAGNRWARNVQARDVDSDYWHMYGYGDGYDEPAPLNVRSFYGAARTEEKARAAARSALARAAGRLAEFDKQYTSRVGAIVEVGA